MLAVFIIPPSGMIGHFLSEQDQHFSHCGHLCPVYHYRLQRDCWGVGAVSMWGVGAVRMQKIVGTSPRWIRKSEKKKLRLNSLQCNSSFYLE